MLGDKAKAADAPDVYTQDNIIGVYRLESEQEIDCDEITEEGTFPKHGTFLKCTEVLDSTGRLADDFCYVVWYTNLDVELVSSEIGEGDAFRVQGCYKDSDGNYQITVTNNVPEIDNDE